MVYPRSRRGSFTRIRAQLPGSFVGRTSSSTRATRSVSFFDTPSLIWPHVPNQSDVAPSLIMQRVEAASGAKYSAHNEKARKFEPIAPVGTNYTPIGKPDIAAMRRVPPAPSSAISASSRPSAKPSVSTVQRPVFGAPVSAPMKTAPSNVPDDDWGYEPPAPPPPPPAASRPPTLPSAPRPAPTSVSISSRCCAL